MNHMMKGRPLLLLLLLTALPFRTDAKEYLLFYLGGQSNMDGYGYLNELPEDLKGSQDGVWIFHGNQGTDGGDVDGNGMWAPLQPGHGVDFRFVDGRNVYSDRFGVELTLAATLQQRFPDYGIALIKYSKGGTSIDCRAAQDYGCWDPDFNEKNGVNQYDHFLATVRHAMHQHDIDGDGTEDRLIPAGIVWMQGESDAAHTADIAFAYEHHLHRLMDLMRAAFRTDDLPVIIGRISDSGQDDDGMVWNYGEIIRAAQAEVARKDPAASLIIATDRYGYSDKWHYDGAGYIDLGRRFAEALAGLTGDGR